MLSVPMMGGKAPYQHGPGLRPLTLLAQLLPNEVLCYAFLGIFPIASMTALFVNSMRAPALGALALVALASALREEQAGGTRKDVPRRCSKGWSLGGSECCSCGDRMGSGVDQDLEVVLDHCEWEDGDAIASKTCCPVWTRDCKDRMMSTQKQNSRRCLSLTPRKIESALRISEENEPEFKKGLKRDCVVTPDTRLYAQCADVAQQLRSAKKALKALIPSKSKRPSSSTLKSFVTGKSNAGKTCHCGCGEISSLDPLQCQNSNDASWEMYCRKTRPCCSDPVKDCKEEDPWPKALEISQEVEKTVENTGAQRVVAGTGGEGNEGAEEEKEFVDDYCVECVVGHDEKASRTAASKSKAKKAGKKKKRQTKKMKKGKKKGNKKGKQEKTTKKNDKNEVKAKQEENGEQGKTDAKKAANQEKKPDHKEEGNKKGKTDESQIQEKNGGKREPHQDEKAKCEKTEDKDKEHTPPAVSPGPSGVDDALGLLGRATTRDLAHACVEDLKAEATSQKSGWTSKLLGKKKKSNQEKFIQELRARDKARNRAKNAERREQWKKEQFVKLSNFVAGVGSAQQVVTVTKVSAARPAKTSAREALHAQQIMHTTHAAEISHSVDLVDSPKYVGLTPQEVAFAEEVLHEAREKVPMDQHGPDAGLVAPALRRLHEVVEADDFEALPAAISAAEAWNAVGVEVSELRFARAVLQQRKELRRTKASEALQRVVASGSATTAVKLTTALAMAKVAGVCARDLNAAEELLKTIREADLRHPRKSALACAHSRPKEGKCLRFAPEVETVFFSA
eukprot:g9631.t1